MGETRAEHAGDRILRLRDGQLGGGPVARFRGLEGGGDGGGITATSGAEPPHEAFAHDRDGDQGGDEQRIHDRAPLEEEVDRGVGEREGHGGDY